MDPLVPRYGLGTLADALPSVLAGMGVPGTANVLRLPESARACLLLVDGLGWESLRAHRDEAPFLSGLAAGAEPITAGFPATTATSIASLGTGLPPGEHGLVGYTFAARDNELLNALGWHRHARGRPVDLRETVVPEQLQPHPTMFERAADAGVAVHAVGPRVHAGSGLTRAVLRGALFQSAYALGDLVAATLAALRGQPRTLCYAYHADLDFLGHIYGEGSDPWRYQLSYVDQLAAMIAGGLRPGELLAVTADHGMVNVTEPDRVDFDTLPELQAGVRMLGGEARVRHVYTEPGATTEVRQAWQGFLGDRAWILDRSEAVAAGWFGPSVAGTVLPRIGDLVVAGRDALAVVRSEVESRLSRFAGHHGSLTPREQLVPMLAFVP
jgi:hypothetical protein